MARMSTGDGGDGGHTRDNGTEAGNADGDGIDGGGDVRSTSPGSSPSTSTRLPPARPSTSPPPDYIPPDRSTDASVPSSDLPVVSGRVPRSRWWYLLPIFLDIIGGVIAYFVLRADDPVKARNCLLLGITLFVIHVAAFLALLLLFPE